MKRFIFVVILLMCIIPVGVNAQRGCCSHHGGVAGCSGGRQVCNDGTLSPTCTCSGGSNSSSRSNARSYSTQRNVYVKSGDNNLRSVDIDNNSVAVSNEMNYTTTNSNPNIVAVKSNNKASVVIQKPDYFLHGENEVSILVTAENGNVKTYKLNIKLISNNVTLDKVKIGKKNITISDEMVYNTKKKSIKLKATANSAYASVTYDKKHKLELGDNIIPIIVVAEDGTSKEYKLNVIREKKPSDNVDVTIKVNGEKVKFKNYISKKVYINNDVDKIKIDYKLSNKKAKIKIKYNKNIDPGNRKIKFVVTAESGKKQEYIIKLYKYNKFEQLFHN